VGRGVVTTQEFHFGEFTLDQTRYRLQRGDRVVRLEKLPMELLLLLVERRGELVSREEIAERLWGKDVFVEADRSINTAISKVRIALRDDPEKPRFVETVVGKGYRFAAPVSCNNGGGGAEGQVAHTEDSSSSPTPIADAPRPPLPADPRPVGFSLNKNALARPSKLLLACIAALIVVSAALIVSRRVGAKGAKEPAIKSLAVLPLKNLSGDPTQEYFADGMTEAIIGRLSSIRELRVISRTSAMRFSDTKMTVPEIAAALHNRVRVHAQLIRTATDEHFWSETYDREVRDVLALQSDVAQSIATKVAVTVSGEERSRLVAARPVSPDVYESYLKAEFGKNNTREEVEQSIAYYQQAIRLDPTFAPAYVGLAEAYDFLGLVLVGGGSPNETRAKVISNSLKALELDPSLAHAHVSLGGTYQKQWKWAEAEDEFKQALALKPNDPSAHLGLASWLMCQGRTDEALQWARRGRELDPLAPSGIEIGWILFHARRYDEAIHELRSVLAVRPDDPGALWFLGFALIGKGQSEDAIPVLEKTASIMHRSPGSLEILSTAYAHAGRRTDALRLMDELKQRRQKGYVPAGAFINAYLALGDYDEAFAGFERAYQEQSNILQFLKVHPFFDPVRGDPRFKDLLRRVGLQESD
jgi:TolB-like protein/DNA-binding winged helix-turn-helix (wHTH) protein/Tfp pilus assembly protein PilF